MLSASGGYIESDISNNIDIFVNIDILSKQIRKYRYFDIVKKNKNNKKQAQLRAAADRLF